MMVRYYKNSNNWQLGNEEVSQCHPAVRTNLFSKNLIKDSLKSDDEEQSSPVPSLTPSFCTKVEEGSTVASCRHHRAKTIYISDFIIHEEAEL